jgi:hypothetical protein
MILGYVFSDIYFDGYIPVLSAFVCFFASFLVIKVFDLMISGGKLFYPRITGFEENGKCDRIR